MKSKIAYCGSQWNCKNQHNRPSMHVDVMAILLILRIPDALFTKPKLIADIKVPEKVVNPEQITAEVTDFIKEAIKSVTGRKCGCLLWSRQRRRKRQRPGTCVTLGPRERDS
jgi:hypothetical protein